MYKTYSLVTFPCFSDGSDILIVPSRANSCPVILKSSHFTQKTVAPFFIDAITAQFSSLQKAPTQVEFLKKYNSFLFSPPLCCVKTNLSFLIKLTFADAFYIRILITACLVYTGYMNTTYSANALFLSINNIVIKELILVTISIVIHQCSIHMFTLPLSKRSVKTYCQLSALTRNHIHAI